MYLAVPFFLAFQIHNLPSMVTLQMRKPSYSRDSLFMNRSRERPCLFVLVDPSLIASTPKDILWNVLPDRRPLFLKESFMHS